MRVNATGQGNSLCLEAIEDTREEISHTRSRVGGGSVCIKNMEALLVWGKVHHIHRPQEFEILLRSEGVKYATKEMAVNGERLRLRNTLSPREG